MTNLRLNFILSIFFTTVKFVCPFGIGKTSGLYGPSDRGIVNLETGNFSSTIVGSKTAWIVEFYSSYCGHCINFAPHFKEFASQIADWNSVIKVGAIDCAQDVNMPVCREYEVMGYPTLKFFPVNAQKTDYGTNRASYSKEVKDIISDMLDYLQKIEGNETLATHMENWPKLESTSASSSQDLWASTNDDTRFIIIVFDENPQSLYGKLLLMDVSSRIKDLKVPIELRRSIGGSDAGQSLLKNLGLLSFRHYPLVVSIERKSPDNKEVLWSGGEILRFDLSRIVNDFIWKNTKSLTENKIEKGRKKEQVTKQNQEKFQETGLVTNKPDVSRRRYSLFLADLENTLLYALSHEIAQRSIISDKSLAALHKFVDVLVKYFPSRPKTLKFLQELRTFVRSHDDVIRGEDLQEKLTDLRVETDAFSDLSKEWLGCRGSKPMFGGFPCGLWSMWHTLTVAQHKAGNTADPKEVLNAMVSYVEEFFGCRECARHFLLEADNGNNIEKEIDSTRMSVLWLWRTHNKANQRLSGDLTDDPAFPKEIFPSKLHCTECYNTQILGSDLWSEFNLNEVLKFLTNLYGASNVITEGLRGGLLSDPMKGESLNDAMVLEQSDKTNYSEKNNQSWTLTFSPVDISLCFGVYILSALILIFVYLKFVARKRFGQVFSSLKVFGKRRSSGTSHLQVGKV